MQFNALIVHMMINELSLPFFNLKIETKVQISDEVRIKTTEEGVLIKYTFILVC